MTRRRLFLWLLVALATPSPLHAQSVGLHWTACDGPDHRTFSCATSSGQHQLVASFVSPVELEVIAIVTQIRVQTDMDIQLPFWWLFGGSGGDPYCRQSALVVEDLGTFESAGCSNPFLGAVTASTVLWNYIPGESSETGSIIQHFSEPVRIPAGTRLIGSALRIRNVFTAGGHICVGCATEVCIVAERITLTRPDETRIDLEGSTGTPNYVSWQQQQVRGTACQGATDAIESTWGAIKSHYR